MGDEQGWWRDFQERPLGFPLLRLYNQFMNIKRYDHMPFYIYPSGVSVVSLEDKFINFLDWLVDAHEEARNPHDKNRHFYARSVFVMNNFLRYSNPTVCNVMFDTQAKRPQYDRLNSVISQQQTKFYLSAIHRMKSAVLVAKSIVSAQVSKILVLMVSVRDDGWCRPIYGRTWFMSRAQTSSRRI